MDNPNYYAILPASVRYDETLTDFAKILFAEITALSNKYGFCTASNGYFAELYKRNVSTISETISELQKRGYLRSEVEENYKRKIYPLIDPLLKKPKGVSGIPEGGVSGKAEDNNINSNTKFNIVSEAENEREKRPSFSEVMGYDTKATQRLLKKSEEFLGRKWTSEGKQKRFIASMLRAGFEEEKIWASFVLLGDDEFWGEKGYDWSTVSSEIGKVKKKKQPIKSYGVKK